MNLSLLKKISATLLLSGLSTGVIQPSASAILSFEIPKSLDVPQGQTLLLQSKARGTQIYVCQAVKNEPDTYQWTLKAPEAKLFNAQGAQKGKHYLGPTWEWQDGSKVQGKVKSKVDAPDAQSIPWLLLEAQNSTPKASGVLSSVKWIQRLNTVGGKAPQTGCDRFRQNREVRVSYTADYYFYGDRP
jgi:FtsP/CotA-like multicopper oxidase with cupredoxin domain